MSLPSKACCNMPPVEVDYKPKGKDFTIQEMKTYKTGSPDATTGILIVGDIFGNVPQTLQGADLLAYGGESSHQYQVFVPDFLQGQYASPSWIPPDTEEKKKAFGAFFAGHGNFGKAKGKIPATIKEIEQETKGTITKWAVVGLCWGGKVATLACGSDTPFAAAVSTHPAMVDPKDGPTITIPYCLLPSKDEDKDAVKAFADAIKVEKYVETFGDMPHGWMAARGDLTKPEIKEGYKRGYETVLNFFHKYL
ncbi:Alpha/Beta hydrolase protein [Usnea florida]